MGKAASILSSLVAVGIIGLLIYFCCLRKKRQHGRTFQTMIIGPATRQPAQQQPPFPQYPVSTAYPGATGPAFTGYGHQQTSAGVTNPNYPTTNYSTAPYPTHNQQHVGMGMPMPSPYPPVSNSGNSQGYAPSAPPGGPSDNDLPPPYSSVMRGS